MRSGLGLGLVRIPQRRCAMLRELTQVGQVPGDAPRRWFLDDDFDLIVWLDEGGRGGQGADAIVGFQLCYDKRARQKALTWRRGSGFTHGFVDDGEGRPGQYKMAPIIQPGGAFDVRRVLPHFTSASAGIEARVRQFVQQTIELGLTHNSPRDR
jgi:hypothetical protein